MGRRKVRLIAIAVTIGVVAVGISFLYAKLNQPAIGQLTVGAALPASNTYNVSLAPHCVSEQYVAYCYPAGMNPRASGRLYGSAVAQNLYFARDIQAWTLGVEIDRTTLSDDSSYTVRQQDPATYAESHITVNHLAITIMADKSAGEFSQAAYLVSGPYVGIVSLVGNDQNGSQPLQTAFMLVLKSWHWQ